MGRTHATSGAVAFLAALPVLTWADDSHGPVTVAVGALTAAGGAMLPDLDHPQATIARSLGPATRLLSELVARLSGAGAAAPRSLLRRDGELRRTRRAVSAAARATGPGRGPPRPPRLR